MLHRWQFVMYCRIMNIQYSVSRYRHTLARRPCHLSPYTSCRDWQQSTETSRQISDSNATAVDADIRRVQCRRGPFWVTGSETGSTAKMMTMMMTSWLLLQAVRLQGESIIVSLQYVAIARPIHRVPKKLSRFVFVRTSSNFHKFR